MGIIIVLNGLALLLQCVSALMALWLMKVTGRASAWVLIAAAISLIVIRRAISYSRMLTGDWIKPVDNATIAETVLLLAISLLLVWGIALIAPLFKAICISEENYREMATSNARDSMELRQLNQMLEQRVTERTQRLEAVNEELGRSNAELQHFAYVASHDLQEPLRKISAFGDRLATRSIDALDDTSRDYLQRMLNAAERMRQLIEDLLTFSRVSTKGSSFTKIEMTEAINEALCDLEEHIRATHGRVEISEMPPIYGDVRQIRQLMQNLIGNGLKFSKRGEPPVIRISGRRDEQGMVEIAIRDNGIGFNPKYLDRIFLPFQRLHTREEYSGSGIGLAICQRIVQRHGGHITAVSVPGEGATFLLTLPAEPPPMDICMHGDASIVSTETERNSCNTGAPD